MKRTVHGSVFTVNNKSGTALVLILLLMSILTSLAIEFAYEVYINTSALSNWQNAHRASLLSKSGQIICSRYIKNLRGVSYTHIREIELPFENISKQMYEDSSFTIKIIDENSKFNINTIIYPNGLINEKAFFSLKKLLEYLNINPSLAMYIADWIDTDKEPRLVDSEHDTKNSYLWSIEELKFINGIDKKTFETIKPYITVNGSGLININTAELPVLVSLSDNMTEALAKKIIDYRENLPFEDKTHIQRVSGLEAIGVQILDRITVKSSDFRVITNAAVNKITRVIESVIDTSMTIQYWVEG